MTDTSRANPVDTLSVDPCWRQETVTAIEEYAAGHVKELTIAQRNAEFPREIYREMANRGWVGVITPQEYGGQGLSTGEYCLISETIAFTGLISPQVSIQAQRWILDWGSAQQKERYLPGVAAGDLVFCECISEPEFGSSFRNMIATAVRDGDDWILNGDKTHVNLGSEADVGIFYANSRKGITSFLVDLHLEGVTRRKTDPVGLRLLPTADVRFTDVRVPADAILGDEGKGLETFLTTFNLSRLGNASELVGFGRRALAMAVRYASSRRVGDNRVTDFQGIQWLLADLYGELFTASLARNYAANLSSLGKEHSLETTIAKKAAIDASEHVASEMFAFVGGHGLYTDADYFRLLGDIKVLRVAGGSKEILRNYIARRALAELADEETQA